MMPGTDRSEQTRAGAPIFRKVGVWSIAIGLVCLLLWAALAPLDEGVPASGLVNLDTKRKPVQHHIGGIVHSVKVQEGDQVKEGDVLLVLDDAVAKANFETLRQRYLAALALKARLQAEQSGATTIHWPEEVRQVAQESGMTALMLAQIQIKQARKDAAQIEINALNASLEGLQGQLDAWLGLQSGKERQLMLVEQELAAMRPLAEDGYVPKLKILELDRQATEYRNSLEELRGQRTRALKSQDELRQRMRLVSSGLRKDTDTQLAEVTRDILADADRLRALAADQSRTIIRAPASGQIVGLVVQSAGAVIQPGQKLMELVPPDERLLVEVRVEPHLIDRVHAGQFTDVRFTGFAHTPHLVVEGVILTVSGDLLTDPVNGTPYFLARIGLTDKGLKALQGRKLHPGMPVDAVIKTGERSLLKYLIHPLLRRMSGTLTEE